jgi:hypothetical protein
LTFAPALMVRTPRAFSLKSQRTEGVTYMGTGTAMREAKRSLHASKGTAAQSGRRRASRRRGQRRGSASFCEVLSYPRLEWSRLLAKKERDRCSEYTPYVKLG